MSEQDSSKRHTFAEGALVKLNLRACECGKVWVPEGQAGKAEGVEPGWYPSLAATRTAFESDPNIDPVIRISSTSRGRIVCSDC